MVTKFQWGDIRAAWTATNTSIREMAREFGASEANIRKRAKNEAWGPRNAPARKRALVEAAMAGARPGAHCALRTPEDAAIENEAEQDIADMRLGASLGRLVLLRCRYLLELADPGEREEAADRPLVVAPKEVKAIAEAARAGLEMIRRARNLDDPKREDDDASPLLALARSIGEARAARPQTA